MYVHTAFASLPVVGPKRSGRARAVSVRRALLGFRGDGFAVVGRRLLLYLLCSSRVCDMVVARCLALGMLLALARATERVVELSREWL